MPKRDALWAAPFFGLHYSMNVEGDRLDIYPVANDFGHMRIEADNRSGKMPSSDWFTLR